MIHSWDNLRKLRLALGLSQKSFAKLVGVHQASVSNWEAGRRGISTLMSRHIARIAKNKGIIVEPKSLMR
jgi:transcriptional regulator with XRE-family HTH domain